VIAAGLLAAVAAALAAEPCALPPPGPPTWTVGETASYDLELFGLVRAGSLQLSVERPSALGGGNVVPLRARARTEASVANVLKLTAIAFSWVDARTLLPEHYREEADENGVRKVSDARLTPAGPAIDLSYELGGKPSASHVPRQGTALDALSAIYYLASAKLAPGDRMCFDLLARGRVWRVTGTVAASGGKIDTVLGKVDTLRIDAQATVAGGPDEKPHQMHVWFTSAAPRRFVAAVGDVDLGPVKVTLTEVRGGQR
jgi:hypothetical protein